MGKEIKNLNYKKTVENLMKSLPNEKYQDIILRRFGIGSQEPETLEVIGKSYNITRERVRQIEVSALSLLKQEENLSPVKDIIDSIASFFEEHGYAIREKKLLDNLTPENQSYLILILTLGDPFEKISETEKFHTLWATDLGVLNRVEKLIASLETHLSKAKTLLEEALVLEFLKKEAEKLDLPQEEYILSNYLDLVHHIQRGHENHFGFRHWPEINPRGMREKAYIVLKRFGQPLHFQDITKLINQTSFLKERTAYPQTVHNELIKDGRFVLIGRGKYALGEWGYEPGVVKEVIRRILENSKRPLTRSEIVEKVLSQREVKPNTISLNLHDRTKFRRLENGAYTFVD